jgi:MscS family membrane protein
MLETHEFVDPESVVVVFTAFADSSLNVLFRAYINKADWVEFHQVQQEIYLNVIDIVEDMELAFAFPSQSLYIESTPLHLTQRANREPGFVPRPQRSNPTQFDESQGDDI